MNINVSETGEILSFGHCFHLRAFNNLSSFDFSAMQAYEIFCKYLITLKEQVHVSNLSVQELMAESMFVENTDSTYTITSKFTLSPSKGYKCFLRLPDDKLEPCWGFEVELEDNWFNAFISAQTGDILGCTDWVSQFIVDQVESPKKSSYMVFPLGKNDPLDGPAEIRFGPASDRASPKGWHLLPMNQTTGNNVIAQENHDLYSDWEYNYRPHGGATLEFLYLYDDTKDPRLSVNASITNLFYWNNLLHDLFYEYGFDEKAGNFQMDNFGRGGSGGDPVIAHAQDGSGVSF